MALYLANNSIGSPPPLPVFEGHQYQDSKRDLQDDLEDEDDACDFQDGLQDEY
jgi:hypothetical protein